MPLTQASEEYCLFSFYENRRVFSQRIHHVQIQDCLGRLWRIDRENVPEALWSTPGSPTRASTCFKLLCGPDTVRPASPPRWLRHLPVPTKRDVLAMVGGYPSSRSFTS